MDIERIIEHYGAIGMLVAMFFESSVVPIPSEAVVIAAGYLGLSLWTIVWAGSIGSTLGGCVGYAIGRGGLRWLIDRYGRLIGLTPNRLKRFDELSKRYGAFSVLIGRMMPIIPFKVFSIASGIGKINFYKFALMTFIGVIPRLIVLSLAGEWLRRATVPAIVTFIIIGLMLYFIHIRRVKYPSKLDKKENS